MDRLLLRLYLVRGMLTPKHTPNQVVAIAEKAVEARELEYDKEKGFWTTFQGITQIRSGDMLPVWTVAFTTPAKLFPFVASW